MRSIVKNSIFALVLLPFSLFVSCVTTITTPIIVDTNIPEDQLAAVYFDSAEKAFYPSEVNEIKLEPRGYALKVPAGETRIKGDMAYIYSAAESKNEVSQVFRRKDTEFIFSFEAGKTYYVKTEISGESQFRIVTNVPFKNTATVLYGPPLYAGVNIYGVEQFNEEQKPVFKNARFISYILFANNVFFGTEK
jgi:hypothetical protein